MLEAASAEPPDVRHMACDSVGLPLSAEWHVLQTKPNVERRVCGDVQSLGFATIFPRRISYRRRYNRVERVMGALFPSYLLVAFDAVRDAWGEILRLRDVRGFLGPMGAPAALRACEAARLAEWDAIVADEEDDAAFAPGDRLRVVSGPLASFVGVCQRSAPERVALLLDMLGRPTVVSFERRLLERAA